jgi:hypothetical protein
VLTTTRSVHASAYHQTPGAGFWRRNVLEIVFRVTEFSPAALKMAIAVIAILEFASKFAATPFSSAMSDRKLTRIDENPRGLFYIVCQQPRGKLATCSSSMGCRRGERLLRREGILGANGESTAVSCEIRQVRHHKPESLAFQSGPVAPVLVRQFSTRAVLIFVFHLGTPLMYNIALIEPRGSSAFVNTSSVGVNGMAVFGEPPLADKASQSGLFMRNSWV